MISEVIEKCLYYKKKYEHIDRLLEEYDVKVYAADLENVYGYTNFLQNNKPIIVYNSNLNEFERDFVILHEMGHILFHDHTTREFSKIARTNREEVEADIFAVIFGGYVYYESTNWLNKKINYIQCNHLMAINYYNIG